LLADKLLEEECAGHYQSTSIRSLGESLPKSH
jgi:hypothetical protein